VLTHAAAAAQRHGTPQAAFASRPLAARRVYAQLSPGAMADSPALALPHTLPPPAAQHARTPGTLLSI
jgi:hypothetical protein